MQMILSMTGATYVNILAMRSACHVEQASVSNVNRDGIAI